MNEPVADALRGYLDGHLVLSRKIAQRGRYPAIDVLASISRLMPKVTTEDHQRRARKVREWLAIFEENRDLISVGAWRRGADANLDKAIEKQQGIENLLYHQGTRPVADTLRQLQLLTGI
jgi:flagellum-specific ATP synthase